MTKKTLTIFWSNTCAPCRILKPELRKLCAELGLEVEEKNIAAHMDDVKRLGIRGVPSVVHGDQILFTGNLGRGTIINCLKANGVLA